MCVCYMCVSVSLSRYLIVDRWASLAPNHLETGAREAEHLVPLDSVVGGGRGAAKRASATARRARHCYSLRRPARLVIDQQQAVAGVVNALVRGPHQVPPGADLWAEGVERGWWSGLGWQAPRVAKPAWLRRRVTCCGVCLTLWCQDTLHEMPRGCVRRPQLPSPYLDVYGACTGARAGPRRAAQRGVQCSLGRRRRIIM